MSYSKRVNHGVNLGRLKRRTPLLVSGIMIRKFLLSQLSDNIPKTLALAPAWVRLLTPSLP